MEFVDTETGECEERRLMHSERASEVFYRELKQRRSQGCDRDGSLGRPALWRTGGGNQAEAARRIGLCRSALGHKLSKYGIKNMEHTRRVSCEYSQMCPPLER